MLTHFSEPYFFFFYLKCLKGYFMKNIKLYFIFLVATWYCISWRYHILLNQHTNNIKLYFSQLLSTTKTKKINIFFISLCMYVQHYLLDKSLKVKLPGQRISVSQILINITKLHSKEAVQISISTRNIWIFAFPHPRQICCIIKLFIYFLKISLQNVASQIQTRAQCHP